MRIRWIAYTLLFDQSQEFIKRCPVGTFLDTFSTFIYIHQVFISMEDDLRIIPSNSCSNERFVTDPFGSNGIFRIPKEDGGIVRAIISQRIRLTSSFRIAVALDI